MHSARLTSAVLLDGGVDISSADAKGQVLTNSARNVKVSASSSASGKASGWLFRQSMGMGLRWGPLAGSGNSAKEPADANGLLAFAGCLHWRFAEAGRCGSAAAFCCFTRAGSLETSAALGNAPILVDRRRRTGDCACWPEGAGSAAGACFLRTYLLTVLKTMPFGASEDAVPSRILPGL